MNKKRFFLQCVLCATFVFGIGSSFAEDAAEDNRIDVTDKNTPLYVPKVQEGQEFGTLEVYDKTIFSDSSIVHDMQGKGLVIHADEPAVINIQNSEFLGIVSNTAGSVMNISNSSIVQSLDNSKFESNGVIAEFISEYDPNAPQYGEGEVPAPDPEPMSIIATAAAGEVTEAPKTTLQIQGGAIAAGLTQVPTEDGSLLYPNDIFSIFNTKFKNNFISAKGSGSSITLDVEGAALAGTNIGYELDAEGKQRHLSGLYNSVPSVYTYDDNGGVLNSEFEGNTISLTVEDTKSAKGEKIKAENASVRARGSAISAGYIAKIDNSKFLGNKILTNVTSAGSASSTVNGGTVYSSGVGSILNSTFENNKVEQSVKGDYANAGIYGGVYSNSVYNLQKIKDNTFKNNSIVSSIIGNNYADVALNGGILSSTTSVGTIQNNIFSGNKADIAVTAPLSNLNAQGGLLYLYSLGTLRENTFTGNALNLSSEQGISLTGGMVASTSYITNLIDNVFENNTVTLSTNAENAFVNVDGGILYSDQTRYVAESGAYTPEGWEPAPEPEPEPLPEPALALGPVPVPDAPDPEPEPEPAPEPEITDISIGTINNAKFLKNKITVNSKGDASSVSVNGAIVRSPLSIDSTINSDFEDNILDINSSGKNAYVSVNGVAVSTPSMNRISNSKFRRNSAIIRTNAENVYVDARGGAASVDAKLDLVSGATFEDNKIEIIAEGATPVSLSAKGGALYLDGTNPIEISNSNFSGNKLVVEHESGIAQGGAIYNNATGTLQIKDTSFENNSAKEGGAIYSNSAVLISAIDKDVNFRGNTASKGSDIYINDSLLELNTNSSDRIISFDGGITLASTGAGVPEMKTTGSGIVNLGAGVNYQGSGKGHINLTGDTTLNVLKDEYISDRNIALTLNDNATLNLANGEGTQIELDNLNVLSANNSVKLDINLDGSQSDYFNLNSATPSNTGVINISKINLLSDATDRTTLVQVSSSGHNVAVDETLFTNKNKYVITPDATETGKIKFYKENDADVDGFAEAVANTTTEHTTFTALDNVTTDLSAKGNSISNDLYVYGNNKTIDFSGKDNISVGDAALLTLDNVSELKNSGSNAMNVSDAGTVEIVSSTTDTKVDTQLNLASANSSVKVQLAGGKAIAFSNKISGDRNSRGRLSVSGGNANFAELDGVSVTFAGPEINLNKKVTSSDLSTVNSSVNIFDNLEDVNLVADASTLNINSSIARSALSAKNSTINLADQSYLNSSSLTLDQAVMPIANNIIGTMDLKSVTLKGKNDISIDVDLETAQADKINAENATIEEGATLNIADFNLTKNTVKNSTLISVSDNADVRQATTTSVREIENGIFTYGVNRQADGNYLFNVTGFDPAIEVAPIAQQAFLTTMVNSYNYSFANMDSIMLKPYKERLAMHYGNKVAIADTNAKGYAYASQYGNGPWFRPYGAIESVRLGHGPKFDNYMYGSIVGYDSDVIRSKNGFDTVISGHVAYNGSTQDYKSTRINQNGASAGLTASMYKKSFFTGLTVAGAVSLADAKTSHGKDDFTMYSVGVASKTGFNIEDEDGYFIFQPNFLASYTFANTNDYTNSLGLRMNSDALNAVQLEPGVNFIFNVSDTFQTYMGGSAVFTIMGDSKFETAGVSLPRMSLDPYGQYKFGLQKRWGERSLGFAQTTFRSGGRTGAELQLGLRMAI